MEDIALKESFFASIWETLASSIRRNKTIIEALMAKVTGEKVNVSKFKQGVKDCLFLAVVSVTLFVIAAFVETYITPHLLGL